MGKALVSIIVPIYNVEKYLEECLSSLERQTFNEIEIILVNDGSTDCSGTIAKSYVNKDVKFRLIERNNGGLSAARNSGLDVATGEYILFVDSDDFLPDDAIEKLYYEAKPEKLDQLRFAAYTFKDGTRDYVWNHDSEEGGYMYLGDYPEVLSGMEFYQRAIENRDYYPSCCLIFTKRSVIENNHLRFLRGILHEDNLFNFQLTTLCDRVAVLNKPLYYRRYRAGSITQEQNWIDKYKAMCISAEITDKFIDTHPQLKGDIGNWQVLFFLSMMMNNWERMTIEEQESQESRAYLERVRRLVYKYGGSNSMKLFYISRPLYRMYKRGTKSLHRLFGGRKALG